MENSVRKLKKKINLIEKSIIEIKNENEYSSRKLIEIENRLNSQELYGDSTSNERIIDLENRIKSIENSKFFQEVSFIVIKIYLY